MKCPLPEIAAYIDGELSIEQQQMLESHMKTCKLCSQELYTQRQIACLIEAAFSENVRNPLSNTFVKSLVTNAESRITGCTNQEEAFRASTLLFLIVLTIVVSASFSNVYVSERIIVSLRFVCTFVAELFFSVSVILKNVGLFIGSDFINRSFLLLIIAVNLIFLARIVFGVEKKTHRTVG